MPRDWYQYIREQYKAPVKVGQRIMADGRVGTVCRPKPSHEHYVWVQFDGDTCRSLIHPTWETVYYADDGVTVLADYRKKHGGDTA